MINVFGLKKKALLNMSKRLKVSVAIAMLLLVLVLALPYYFGKKAEQTLTKQHELIATAPWIEVVNHQYERGWFSSTETTIIRLKPNLIKPYQDMLPESLREVMDKTVTYQHHIKHGPFPQIGSFNFRPSRAWVSTEFIYSEDMKKTLTRFFGEESPVTLNNHIGIFGGGELTLYIPKFDYEELSGIKINWQGLDFLMNYEKNFSAYKTQVNSNGISMKLVDKGELKFGHLAFSSDTQAGKTGVNLGSTQLNLDEVNFSWDEGIPYSIRLNEIIGLLTQIQIGAFINPAGEIAPSKVRLEKLQYRTEVKENGEFVDAVGKLGFEKFNYGTDLYGPLDIQISANHLDGKSLVALKSKFANLAVQNLPSDQMREQMITAAKTEGLPLLQGSPIFKIDTFKLQLPSGLVDIKGQIALNKLDPADLDDFNKLVAKIDANLDVYVPQQLLENLAVAQSRALFGVDESAENQPDMTEVAETAKLLVQGMIGQFQEAGYVSVEGGMVHTRLKLKDNKFLVNDKPFVMEDDSADVLSDFETDHVAASDVSDAQ